MGRNLPLPLRAPPGRMLPLPVLEKGGGSTAEAICVSCPTASEGESLGRGGGIYLRGSAPAGCWRDTTPSG